MEAAGATKPTVRIYKITQRHTPRTLDRHDTLHSIVADQANTMITLYSRAPQVSGVRSPCTLASATTQNRSTRHLQHTQISSTFSTIAVDNSTGT